MQTVAQSEAFGGSREAIIDALFDPVQGIGLDIARLRVGEASKSQLESDSGGQLLSFWQEEDAPLQWDQDEGQVWAAQRAAETNPDLQVIAAPWSAPYWMKKNGSVLGVFDGVRGELKDEHYETFAHYLAEYVKGYRREHGITISALSATNEPNLIPKWASTVFTPEQYIRFFKRLGEQFANEGIDTRLIGPEESEFPRSRLTIESLHSDPQAWRYLDTAATHSYGLAAPDVATAELDVYDKSLWMTEMTERGADLAPHALSLGQRIHAFVTGHDATAYLYWLGVVYPSRNDMRGAVSLLGSNAEGEFAPNKKYYVMGQYSRFITPGNLRIAASGGTDTLLVSAFTRADGTNAVAVLVNWGTEDEIREISGWRGHTLGQHRTSAEEDLAQLDEIDVREGASVVMIPGRSVVTLVEDP